MSSFKQYYVNVIFDNFSNFNGKATRREYWMFVLYNAMVITALSILDLLLFKDGRSIILSIYEIVVLVPTLAISVRRMHDIEKSGWTLLWGIIPIFGAIYLIVLSCLPSVCASTPSSENPNNIQSSSSSSSPSSSSSSSSFSPSPQSSTSGTIRDKWNKEGPLNNGGTSSNQDLSDEIRKKW